MGTKIMILTQVGLIIVFIFYYFAVFELVGTILENPRLTRVQRIPLEIASIMICFAATLLPQSTSVIGYLVLGMLFVVNFQISFKDKLVCNIFCASACLMHVMSVRSMSISIYSIVLHKSIYDVANNPLLLNLSMGTALLFLCIVILLVIKVIPAKNIKIISQHAEQLWFMIVWITLFNVYLLSNSKVYTEPLDHPNLTLNQLIAPLSILLGLYVVLFFSIKTTLLLGYKEKSEVLQQVVDREKQYRKTVMKDAIMTFESNFTQNEIIKGFREYKEELGDIIHSYREMQLYFANEIVHTDDRKEFLEYSQPWKIIKEYERGITEVQLEYRRLMDNDEYFWVREITNLWEDPETKEIKGYTYIKNINEEKNKQIELKDKAEKDSLTGLYNKGTVAKIITEYLFIADTEKQSALLIIDVDNFKNINDHLGHTYGDAVLCELAEKLKNIFSDEDIAGRIGGDEFMVFIKNASSIEFVKQKAEEINKEFYKVYTGENKAECIISASVGISIFPKDGIQYMDLYKNADIALYSSKRSGKNTYHFYQGESFEGYEANRTEINMAGEMIQKNFRQNRIEYIFKILYDTDNYDMAVNTVLELITRHFSLERGYIIEKSEDNERILNIFEWCGEGVPTKREELSNGFGEKMEAIFQLHRTIGTIGFDTCKEGRTFSDSEMEELKTICSILETFIIKQRIKKKSEQTLYTLTTILNNMDSFMYVIGKETYEILYANRKTIGVTGDVSGRKVCYNTFRDIGHICDDCPIKGLEETMESKSVKQIYNEKYNIWTETTATYIQWWDGETAYLINSTDITKYKKAGTTTLQKEGLLL